MSDRIFDPLDCSTTFLVETSAITAPFLCSIRENLIKLFDNPVTYGLRFNIGYFSRETSLWDDEAVEFSMHTAAAAIKWTREWPVVDFSFTPRGRAQHSGPHVVPALVAAFSDSAVKAVYLIAGSAPFERTNDVVNHLSFAAKDRPVHVVFVTGQRNVDFKAMEILHIISKETRGTFRVAYFDAMGQILQVLKAEDKRRETGLLSSSLSTEKMALVPTVYGGRNAFAVEPSRAENTIRIKDLLAGSFPQKTLSTGGFDDIKIPLPEHGKRSQYPSSSPDYSYFGNQKYVNQFFHEPVWPTVNDSFTTRHMKTQQTFAYPTENESWVRFKDKMHKEDRGISDEQMSEIRKMFSKLYMDKKKKEHKKKAYKSVKAKVYEFKNPKMHKRSHSDSEEDNDSYSSEDSDIDSVLEDVKSLKAAARQRKQSINDLVAGRPVSQLSHRPWSSRSFRSVSSEKETRRTPSREKSVWKPTGNVSSGFVSRPQPTTNRSQAWMDPWQNAMLKKQNEMNSRKQTKSVQTGYGVAGNTMNRRPQISNSTTLQRNYRSLDDDIISRDTESRPYTKTDNMELETIRELVKTNNNLVRALEKKETSTDEQRRIEQNRNKIFSKIKAAQPQSRGKKPGLAEIAAKKQEVLGELKDLAITNRSLEAINQIKQDRMREQQQKYGQLRLNRQEQIQNMLNRKQDIRQQRQQECYKSMYDKLVGDITARNQKGIVSGVQPPVVSAGVQHFEKPIAIIPQ